MAKKNNRFLRKLSSLVLLVMINVLVFNASDIVDFIRINTGLADLNWHDITTLDISMDKILGNRAQVFSFHENIIINLDDEIHIYDIDGKIITKKEINSDTTKMIGLENAFVVSDFIQGNVYIIDYLGNIIGTVDGLGKLDEIIAVRDNIFAVIGQDGYLKIFNVDGDEISSVTLPKGEFLNVDVSKDKELLMLTILSSDAYGFNTKMLTYSMTDNVMIGGHNNTDKLVYKAMIFDEDVVIVDFEGVYVEKISEVGNDPYWQFKRVGELITFDIDKNGNYVEINKDIENEDILGVGFYHFSGINKDGVVIFNHDLEKELNNITLGYGKIVLYDDYNIHVYNSNGDLLVTRETNKSIYDITWLTETRMLLEYNDVVEIVELTY